MVVAAVAAAMLVSVVSRNGNSRVVGGSSAGGSVFVAVAVAVAVIVLPVCSSSGRGSGSSSM